MGDLGLWAKVRLKVEAQSATMRSGLGKVRYIEVNQLWLQEAIATGRVTVQTVTGKDNLAGALTKYFGR